jgi:hypothetical protein
LLDEQILEAKKWGEVNMRFKGHGTFYIRRGWLPKGMKQVVLDTAVFFGGAATVTFGLGTNQVSALRYWLQAAGLIKQVGGQGKFGLTDLGGIIKENDPYMEEIGTLALIHYQIAKSEDWATSWYYFFNAFSMYEFTREDFVNDIWNSLEMKGIKLPAKDSISSDFDCLKNSYLKEADNADTDFEDNKECPLVELGLLQCIDPKKKIYKKTQGRGNVPLEILLAIIVAENRGAYEVKIQKLLDAQSNIGKIFNLDTVTLFDYLDELQEAGLIQVIRTAGLDVIKLNEQKDWLKYVADYYRRLSI